MDELVVIVLNYIDYKETQKCIDNLLGIGYKMHIIIVDNNSPNNSFEILRDYYSNENCIRVIHTKRNGGYSSGNNYGVRYVLKKFPEIEYIAIMNPDILIQSSRSFSSNIAIMKQNKSIGAITSKIVQNGICSIESSGWATPSVKDIIISDTLLLRKLFRSKVKKSENKNQKVKRVDAVHGSFFIVRKELFNNSNLLFDENVFMYYEENILSMKMKAKGLIGAVNLTDEFIHNHKFSNQTCKNAIKSAKWRRKSQQYYLRVYLKTPTILRLVIYIIYSLYIYVELPTCKMIKRLISYEKN